MSTDRCATCAFFRGGECHRNAPQSAVGSPGAGPVWAFWPTVKSADWCGEFKPAPRKPGHRHGHPGAFDGLGVPR
jgi:hypothetical protein